MVVGAGVEAGVGVAVAGEVEVGADAELGAGAGVDAGVVDVGVGVAAVTGSIGAPVSSSLSTGDGRVTGSSDCVAGRDGTENRSSTGASRRGAAVWLISGETGGVPGFIGAALPTLDAAVGAIGRSPVPGAFAADSVGFGATLRVGSSIGSASSSSSKSSPLVPVATFAAEAASRPSALRRRRPPRRPRRRLAGVAALAASLSAGVRSASVSGVAAVGPGWRASSLIGVGPTGRAIAGAG